MAVEDNLIGQLREMDMLAFQISQCTSFKDMQPHIQKLIDAAAKRQRAESTRISNLMVHEIKAAYTDPTPPKLTEQPPTRLLK